MDEYWLAERQESRIEYMKMWRVRECFTSDRDNNALPLLSSDRLYFWIA